MTFILRYLVPSDIPRVAEIEKEAFPTQWPRTSFKQDLKNDRIQYLVATQPSAPTEDPNPDQGIVSPNTPSLLGRLFHWPRGHAPYGSELPIVPRDLPLGYVSLWFLTEEAHVTAIAVQKTSQGVGLGEFLLIGAIETAMSHNSRVVTLEVRVSNHKATSLYEKYGFRRVGTRRGYYTDNREDAAIMTTDPIHSLAYQEQVEDLRKAFLERRGSDHMVLRLVGT